MSAKKKLLASTEAWRKNLFVNLSRMLAEVFPVFYFQKKKKAFEFPPPAHCLFGNCRSKDQPTVEHVKLYLLLGSYKLSHNWNYEPAETLVRV